MKNRMSNRASKYDILVIGGGPAGMMAAIAAAQAKASVRLLEGNSELGIKLMMTGKGRCNITNAEKDRHKFLELFGKNGKFLYTAFGEFGPEEVVGFFEGRGVATKIERGGRIFPVSDKAGDVRQALIEEMKRLKVDVARDARVSGLDLEGGKISKVTVDGKDDAGFDKVILATGGLSYPGSGSNGDGLRWAEKAGHTIVLPRPALTPVITREKWVRDLEGLSLKNVGVSIYQDGKKQDSRFGEALFTDKGMSGPVILDLSKKVGELLRRGSVKLAIDFKPALDFTELDKRVQKDFGENQNRMFRNSLGELLPQKLIPVIICLADIDPEKKVNLVTKEERKRLIHILKGLELEVEGLVGFDKAVVTSGGVNLREIDPRTMKSRLVDNLYFAGEVLDLDAPTGGFNLQCAWSTGHLAGKSAAEDTISKE